MNRQDPFRVTEVEPVEDTRMGLMPTVLQRPPRGKGRGTAIRPTELRRRQRRLHITFSTEDIPDRLEVLAERWGVTANNGSLAVSQIVEYLLLPRLEAAERGEINVPGSKKAAAGGQWY